MTRNVKREVFVRTDEDEVAAIRRPATILPTHDPAMVLH